MLADPVRRKARLDDLRATAERRAEGAVAELAAYAHGWDVNPADVRVPVFAWHAREDDAAPLAPTQRFVAAMRGSRFQVVEGGHLAPLLETEHVAWALAGCAA